MPYLNHAGTSWPKPEPVQRAVAGALAAGADTWATSLAVMHERVARWAGTTPERLLLTPGCTSALAVALADLPWIDGDRLVISSFEHHALHRQAQLLAHRGVEVLQAPPASRADGGPLDLDWLEDVLRAGGVRLVALSAASNVTGALLPWRQARELARRHGALLLLDAAQVAGWEEPDPDVDLWTFAGHKGPQAPWGVGGLVVAPGVTMATPGAVCSTDARVACAPMPGHCDVGSVDRAALAGLCAGLDWLAARPERLAVARSHIARLAERLEAMANVTLLGPREPVRRVPTLAVTIAGASPGVVARGLSERGVIAGAGLLCAPLAHDALGTGPDGVVRFSAGPDTTNADVDHAAGALEDTVRAVATP